MLILMLNEQFPALTPSTAKSHETAAFAYPKAPSAPLIRPQGNVRTLMHRVRGLSTGTTTEGKEEEEEEEVGGREPPEEEDRPGGAGEPTPAVAEGPGPWGYGVGSGLAVSEARSWRLPKFLSHRKS